MDILRNGNAINHFFSIVLNNEQFSQSNFFWFFTGNSRKQCNFSFKFLKMEIDRFVVEVIFIGKKILFLIFMKNLEQLAEWTGINETKIRNDFRIVRKMVQNMKNWNEAERGEMQKLNLYSIEITLNGIVLKSMALIKINTIQYNTMRLALILWI